MVLDLLIRDFILTSHPRFSLIVYFSRPASLPPPQTPPPLPSHHWTIIAVIVCTNELWLLPITHLMDTHIPLIWETKNINEKYLQTYYISVYVHKSIYPISVSIKILNNLGLQHVQGLLRDGPLRSEDGRGVARRPPHFQPSITNSRRLTNSRWSSG